MEEQIRLLDGFYKADGHFLPIWRIEGNKVYLKDGWDLLSSFFSDCMVEYGDFGPANQDIMEKVGESNFNMKVTCYRKNDGEGNRVPIITFGVIFDGGKRGYMKGMLGLCTLQKITDEEVERLKDDFEPMEAPPGPYKIQPDVKGKLVWLTGAPGMGKSTSAQLLAKEHGYVYYEADCFFGFRNPFIDLNVPNPSMAMVKQKNLNGDDAQKRLDILRRSRNFFDLLRAGKPVEMKNMKDFYTELFQDIKKQKERIGGNFAIAHVIIFKELKDLMREILGEDLIIVNLMMPAEEKRKRLMGRHDGDKAFVEMMESFEKIIETNGGYKKDQSTVDLKVNGNQSKEDVVNEILKIVQ